MYTSGPYKRIPLCLWSEISEIGSHLSKHKFCAHMIFVYIHVICVNIYNIDVLFLFVSLLSLPQLWLPLLFLFFLLSSLYKGTPVFFCALIRSLSSDPSTNNLRVPVATPDRSLSRKHGWLAARFSH